MELKEGLIFNQMSEYYDQFRPGYPNEIIETIIKKAQLTGNAKVLEIGSGSGKQLMFQAILTVESRIFCRDHGVGAFDSIQFQYFQKRIQSFFLFKTV